MAETSSLTFEKCIIWKTRLPSELDEGPTTSPSFLVQGSEWHLELISDSIAGYQSNFHEVFLSRTNVEEGTLYDKLENIFEVSPFIQKNEYILLPCDTIQNVRVDRAYQRIAQFNKRDIENHLPNIGFDEDVFIGCRFRLPASDVSSQNEKLEVKTQTDFVDYLPVRNDRDVKLSSDASLDSLSVDLAKLLDDKLVPDINLRCGDRKVAAHKAILSARSRVFSAMFQSKMSESETGVVDITDVDADVLEMFLKYIYSGRLPDLPDEGLPSLYAAADKYDVRALKKECSERMINNLSQENCLNVLLLANAYSDQDFKNVILDFILNQMEILGSDEWIKFSKENPSLSIEIYAFVVQRKWLQLNPRP